MNFAFVILGLAWTVLILRVGLAPSKRFREAETALLAALAGITFGYLLLYLACSVALVVDSANL